MSDPTQTRSSLDPRSDLPSGLSEARLVVVHPSSLAGEIPLSERSLIIGRNPDGSGSDPGRADEGDLFRLRDSTVSRRHLEVRWVKGAHHVKDLGSRNGSRVNGSALAIDETLGLAAQDVLRIGDVVMVYDAKPPRGWTENAALPGRSSAIGKAVTELERAAKDVAPVLLIGETGTGKEHAAREIHRLSARSGPCLAVNCAELSPQLFESQLFGHERGAFTGAEKKESGLFRAADGGTLFLDEIGELPLDLQPKLLRVIQEGEVRSVGSVKPEKIDVRLVAATNADLPRRVEQERFRRDLYARLSLWEIRLPPLRDRRADVIQWLELLHQRWSERRSVATQPFELSAEAAEAIVLDRWPDNLRGLDRLVHRLAQRDDSLGPLGRAEIETLLTPTSPLTRAAPRAEEEDDAVLADKPAAPKTKAELEAVMAEHGGSVRAVAKYYGRDRRQIYRWLKTFGLREG